MSIIISGISLPFTAPEEEALAEGRKLLKSANILKFDIIKKSIDARKKDSIKFVYSLAAETTGDEAELIAKLANPQISIKKSAKMDISHGGKKMESRPIIVGFGPAGIFSALLLAREGYAPIVIERGMDVDNRVNDVRAFWENGMLNTESNVQFGEGGAGTFSDGKLTTRIGDPLCSFILDEFVSHGAPADILVKAKPHLGTDKLRGIIKSIRQEIIALGGEVHFGQKLESISFLQDGSLGGIKTNSGDYETQSLILAIGHSARDSFRMLDKSPIFIESKAFSVGARIEHRQSDIDKMLYGKYAGDPRLPVGEYQLSHRTGDRAVYTFCMCPGGVVVPAASSDGHLCTNGMSFYARDMENANSALVVSVNKSDFGEGALDGVLFQEKLERAAFMHSGGSFAAPAQTVSAFMGRGGLLAKSKLLPSYSLGTEEADFAKLLPPQITSMMREGLRRWNSRFMGFATTPAVLTGVETRTSSPVRIKRNESFQSVTASGVYPCGEGAGYAGGIMSAAVDGLKVALAIIAKYSAPK